MSHGHEHSCCGNNGNCCHQEQAVEQDCSQQDEKGNCCGDTTKCADETGGHEHNCGCASSKG